MIEREVVTNLAFSGAGADRGDRNQLAGRNRRHDRGGDIFTHTPVIIALASKGALEDTEGGDEVTQERMCVRVGGEELQKRHRDISGKRVSEEDV